MIDHEKWRRIDPHNGATGADRIPVNMPLVASTGPVLAHNGMIMGMAINMVKHRTRSRVCNAIK